MDDLFGSDSESTGDMTESTRREGPKKVTVECPRYPRIQSDGKVRNDFFTALSFQWPFLTLYCFIKMYFTRLATIFGMQQTPFRASSYTGEDQEPMMKVDDFGQTKMRKAPEHIIRWRYARNNKGEKVKQSNAKMVRWSDGTLCLYAGEECFTVTESNLRVPHQLCTKSSAGIQSQADITSRLMFQPTSKAAASRGAQHAAPVIDQPVVITSKVQTELKARAEAQEESNRLSQQSSKKRRGGPTASRLDADFLEEGSDLGATKAAYKSRVALAREGSSSKRLMDIKSGRKKKKKVREEEEDDGSDDSFIASDGEVSEPSFSDEDE
jgi:hypothetical protein